MGTKRRNKKNHREGHAKIENRGFPWPLKNKKALVPIRHPTPLYQDKCAPKLYPKIIPQCIFEDLAEYLLSINPVHRNLFFTVEEVSMNNIVEDYDVQSSNSPTDILIFCIRDISSDVFSPIGMVQINKRKDQSRQLAIVWQTFIQDLAILRVMIIASLSPSTALFHNVLSILTENPDLGNHSGPILYSVHPYKEILHLYDAFGLQHGFDEAFCSHCEVYFLARNSEESGHSLDDLTIYNASWTDVLLALTSEGVHCSYTIEGTPSVALGNKYIQQCYERASRKGRISTETRSSTGRLMRLLGDIFELMNVDKELTPEDLQNFYASTEDWRIVLSTARFKVDSPEDPSRAVNKQNRFDIFLEKMFYDSDEVFNKTHSPLAEQQEIDAFEAQRAFALDHACIRKPRIWIKSPTKLFGDENSAQNFENITSNFSDSDTDLYINDGEISKDTSTNSIYEINYSKKKRLPEPSAHIDTQPSQYNKKNRGGHVEKKRVSRISSLLMEFVESATETNLELPQDLQDILEKLVIHRHGNNESCHPNNREKLPHFDESFNNNVSCQNEALTAMDKENIPAESLKSDQELSECCNNILLNEKGLLTSSENFLTPRELARNDMNIKREEKSPSKNEPINNCNHHAVTPTKEGTFSSAAKNERDYFQTGIKKAEEVKNMSELSPGDKYASENDKCEKQQLPENRVTFEKTPLVQLSKPFDNSGTFRCVQMLRSLPDGNCTEEKYQIKSKEILDKFAGILKDFRQMSDASMTDESLPEIGTHETKSRRILKPTRRGNNLQRQKNKIGAQYSISEYIANDNKKDDGCAEIKESDKVITVFCESEKNSHSSCRKEKEHIVKINNNNEKSASNNDEFEKASRFCGSDLINSIRRSGPLYLGTELSRKEDDLTFHNHYTTDDEHNSTQSTEINTTVNPNELLPALTIYEDCPVSKSIESLLEPSERHLPCPTLTKSFLNNSDNYRSDANLSFKDKNPTEYQKYLQEYICVNTLESLNDFQTCNETLHVLDLAFSETIVNKVIKSCVENVSDISWNNIINDSLTELVAACNEEETPVNSSKTVISKQSYLLKMIGSLADASELRYTDCYNTRYRKIKKLMKDTILFRRNSAPVALEFEDRSENYPLKQIRDAVRRRDVAQVSYWYKKSINYGDVESYGSLSKSLDRNSACPNVSSLSYESNRIQRSNSFRHKDPESLSVDSGIHDILTNRPQHTLKNDKFLLYWEQSFVNGPEERENIPTKLRDIHNIVNKFNPATSYDFLCEKQNKSLDDFQNELVKLSNGVRNVEVEEEVDADQMEMKNVEQTDIEQVNSRESSTILLKNPVTEMNQYGNTLSDVELKKIHSASGTKGSNIRFQNKDNNLQDLVLLNSVDLNERSGIISQDSGIRNITPYTKVDEIKSNEEFETENEKAAQINMKIVTEVSPDTLDRPEDSNSLSPDSTNCGSLNGDSESDASFSVPALLSLLIQSAITLLPEDDDIRDGNAKTEAGSLDAEFEIAAVHDSDIETKSLEEASLNKEVEIGNITGNDTGVPEETTSEKTETADEEDSESLLHRSTSKLQHHDLNYEDATMYSQPHSETKTASKPENSAITYPESQANDEDVDADEEIDYKQYRRSLLSAFCNKKATECDTIYKNKDTFNQLHSQLPEDSEPDRICNDWLCTLKGYFKLKQILEKRNIKRVTSNIFNLEHVYRFISLIRCANNPNAPQSMDKHQLIDYQLAIKMLHLNVGAILMLKDKDD